MLNYQRVKGVITREWNMVGRNFFQRDPNLGEMPLRTLLGLNPLLLGWNPTLFMEKKAMFNDV
jgi:hypothetical protein